MDCPQRQQVGKRPRQDRQQSPRKALPKLSTFQIVVLVSCALFATSSSTCHGFVEPSWRFTRVPSPISGHTNNQRSLTTFLRQSSIAVATNSNTSLHSVATTMKRAVNTVALKWTDFHKQQTTTKPPVVLLHGLLGNKRNFASVATSLGAQLDTPRRIVGVDLRNHGDSEWSDTMSYTDMAYDVLDFLDSQGLDQVVLVGHSMGGKVAQALSLVAPDRVAGLVVLDIAPVRYSETKDPHWKAVVDILQAMHAATEQALAGGANGDGSPSLTKRSMDKQLRQAIPDPALRAFVLTNFGKEGWKIPLSTILSELDGLAGFDYQHHNGDDGNNSKPELQYEGDVFFIHGGQSRFVRHAYMDRIADFFPNHMLTTVRGAGHWIHAERPDDVCALLKRYLDR